ncbi:glycoside hydrolase family 16 protein, partial [Myriangium duriaei CBS 260.36]
MARFLVPHSSSFIRFSALLLVLASCSAGWVLQDDYNPSNWFSMFDFFTGADPTHGLVNYQAQSAAQSDGLINTNNNQVYMGVDHVNLAPYGRASVRLTSKKSYNAGTLMILDLAHMPEGLGTWPAFWTVGPNWPAGGEIDIIEGVNLQSTNAMTLHTADGCSISNNGAFTGSISTSNCYVYAPGQSSNAGCSIATSNTNTYGSGFNAAGGGVYAMVWTTTSISVYFFQRGSIPSDITSGNPVITNWGKPLAEFSGSCNIPQFFQNNQIVFDTTFCGDWAGNVWSTSGGQSATYPTCASYVANNPGAFANAYWKINSLKVY